MSLPEIVLDDRGFQDLVNEARKRISQACPEWNEHNVSDPGVTLIELFAWMTDILLYRVNRIPDKLHVALLELLGITLEAPTAATADLRFRLSTVATQPVTIGVGTEVGTVRTAAAESIVFSTIDDFVIPALRMSTYMVERSGELKDIGVASGTASPRGRDQLPFGMPPAAGDALYLGFDEPIARLLLALDVECSQARGPGVDPDDPPLRWEVSVGDDRWLEVEVLEDRTGGFNYGSGVIEVEIPPTATTGVVAATRAHWLRCRVDRLTRTGGEGAYSHPPEIYALTAGPIGALVPAAHAATETGELLGESDGTPGQTFNLRHAPVIATGAGEMVEVRDPGGGDWVPWQQRTSFVESGRDDQHYVLDPAVGAVHFGPAVRQPDGNWRIYGAAPPKGAIVRMRRYQHGGGRDGNVAAEMLNSPKSSIPGIAGATNPRPAVGGLDPESLESARMRAAMELRTRHRAVTAADYEYLCREASPRVARAKCLEPAAGGVVRLRLLAGVSDPDRMLLPHELVPDEDLRTKVAEYLDERRMLGMTVELGAAQLRGVSVVVNVQAGPGTNLGRVEDDVRRALYRYLNPLVGGAAGAVGEGWGFGRALNQGELFGVVGSVAGVEFVKILRVYETDPETGKQDSKPAGSHIVLEPDEVLVSSEHIVKAEPREV
jgi:predicted phage baseplate assembly protein